MFLRGWLVCVVAVTTAGNAAAQEKPNFAGRWVMAPESANAPVASQGGDAQRGAGGAGAARGGRGGRGGDMGSGWGSNITITQEANRLVVEYAFFGRGDMQPPLKFSYALDGSETKNSVMMGRGIQVQTSKTSWDGNNLIIATLHPFTNPANGQPETGEVRQTLSLQSPTSLLVEVLRSGVLGGPSSTTRTVYVRNQN